MKYCGQDGAASPFNVTFEAPESFTPKGSQKAIEYIPVTVRAC